MGVRSIRAGGLSAPAGAVSTAGPEKTQNFQCFLPTEARVLHSPIWKAGGHSFLLFTLTNSQAILRVF